MAYTTYLWLLAGPEKATPLGSKWWVRLRIAAWVIDFAVAASYVVVCMEGHPGQPTGYCAGVYVGCVLAATLDLLLAVVAVVIVAIDPKR
jgi:hypothetical protein